MLGISRKWSVVLNRSDEACRALKVNRGLMRLILALTTKSLYIQIILVVELTREKACAMYLSCELLLQNMI